VPMIGYLSPRSSESDVLMLDAFRRGLNDTGHIEGQNVAIEYRFTDGQSDRLLALATELTDRHVAVIVWAGVPVTEEAIRFMRASQIPIVFETGVDPVRVGLVSSLNRPGGHMTGSSSLLEELTAKQLSLLLDLVPKAKKIAVLGIALLENDAREAAATRGVNLLALRAATDGEIDAAFAAVDLRRPDALLVGTSFFFVTRAKQIAALAARHGVPAIYARREFAAAGGLMSYGHDVADGYRGIGKYTGRILKGEKPSDLPVFQPTKFEFVINLKTAKALGLEIPPGLLAIADEVIE